jgi:hypothetical protein
LEIAAIDMRLAVYAVQPFPGKLIIYGSVSGLIEMIIVDAIVGSDLQTRSCANVLAAESPS